MAGTGDTRIAASAVPRSSAPTPPIRNSLMLTQKNWTNRSALSVSTETNSLIVCPWTRQTGEGQAGGCRPGRWLARDGGPSVLLELRRLRRGAGLAQRAVVDLPPGAVGEGLGEDGVH